LAFTKNNSDMFNKIQEALNKISENNCNDFEDIIRFLAKKEVTLKGMICFDDIYSKTENDFIIHLLNKIEVILDPIFETIIDSAFKDYLRWFKLITTDGDKNVELSQTQMKMIYWIMYRAIRKKSISDIYSVVMPRGGGKSYIIASLGVFFAYEHEKYCINKTDNKYVILITSPSEDNLTQFLSYVRDFSERTNIRYNSGIELARNNDDLIRLKKNNITYSEIFFKLAGRNAKAIEGVNLLPSQSVMVG
jgi:phage terminase large subunit-like protein